jgi:TolB-like protein/class 3 adenylate cyclase/Flp pilus assembly protein TadD
MPTEINKGIELEIAYVLFIDIVGYSKLVTHEQRRLLELLNRIVREAEHFRMAEANGRLITVPTGDGMALVFYNTPEAPVECALEIGLAGREHPELKLRMGMHSGPVSGVVDVSGRSNIAGAGINIAQRVMDCGDAGHLLISKHMAEDLEHYGHWKRHLHDLGECEVKHGVRIAVVNLYTEEHGNPEVPQKFRQAPVVREKKGRGWIIAFAVVLIATIIIVAVLLSRRSGPVATGSGAPPPPALPATPMRTAAAIPEKSIAVMPFENLSEDKANAYFADGIQDEILTRLSKIADLKVISRTSTQHFKSSPDDLPQIAKQLGIAHILEGSVQKAGDEVRVNVQLIDAASAAHLWAESYDRRLNDIFSVESEIAKMVADTLQAKLTGWEKRAISTRPTDNPVAYQDYLKGRYFWNKRTGNDFKTAISYFEQAVDKDPGFALAYAGLADAYVLLPAFTSTAPQDAMPKAKVAAQKALELDDTLAEAHTSLAMVLRAYDFDYARAVAEFRRAIELNPNYAPAHYWFGTHVLSGLGRFDEAIAEVQRAIELDPLSLVANVDVGTTYVYARRFDDAIDQLRKAIELNDSFYYAHYQLGIALECKGLIDAAIAEYEKAHQLNDDPYVSSLLGHAYALRGRRDDALKMLAQLRDESAHHYVPAAGFAIIYLGLGDKDEALDWLEKGFSDRDGWNIGFVKVDPMLDGLRGNPRFEALVQKVFAPKSSVVGSGIHSP